MLLHRALGLTDEEAEDISRILSRQPNELELAMYGVMWSEHCSYKSSRIHLRRLPTEGDHVMVGPGENAGVIDAGDGVAVALRIESHNHPSAIEPYQGAATGVGGIIRDIFTMGARPIALMDPLRLGPLDDARSRWLFDGIVRGIGGYGNAVGVPTLGGEVVFDRCYARNPLVNVMCVGLLPHSRLVLAKASGSGNLAVLLGSSTGRDGIGGVSVLASAEFGEEEEGSSKRPSVQVADPYEEKRLIEACLELLERGLVVGIQDLGGAGLTCAASETAARGGMGMDVYVSEVPLREGGMVPAEVMTSESQERMLAIVSPDSLDQVLAIASNWEVRAAVVGVVTEPEDGVGRFRVLDRPGGSVLADVPAASLSDDAPLYDRERRAPKDLAQALADDPGPLAESRSVAADLLAMLADSSWVWQQYDHQLFANTVVGPGSDAAVVRLAAPGVPSSGRTGLAISTDGTGRWCALEPKVGAAMGVAEAALNVACTGGRPAALVNCLNFGNPEHPEVMWQLSEAIDGLAMACRALSLPVVGGNVSLYNASEGADIDPTPVVGVVGLIEELASPPPGAVLAEGCAIILVGADSESSLGASRWAVEVCGHRGGRLPGLDLDAHARVVEFVTGLVAAEVSAEEGAAAGIVSGIHDLSDGGLALCVAEMAARSGVGAVLDVPVSHGYLFNEAPSRVLICTSDPDAVLGAAGAAGVVARVIGQAGGSELRLGTGQDGVAIPIGDLAGSWSAALGQRMASFSAPEPQG